MADYTPPGLPTAPAFPAASPYPQPTTDPRSGVNPYSGTSQPSTGFTFMVPETATALTAAGFPASEGMTQDEAEAQSQVALSKIAAVNPELAQQLIEQREGGGSGG